ncbi:hypothetical protein J1614_003522 [Plenodomus biglobosus]|nr:hypothetical protein J1614_003522 [Plenodomus biglobosus]
MLNTNNDDDNYSHDLSLGMRNHDGFGNADFLTKDHHKTDGIEDALNLELVNRPELSSALSTPLTRS